MQLIVGLVFFLAMAVPLAAFRPAPFFDKDGKPYAFGLKDDKMRPCSLLVVFMALAALAYFLAVMFAPSAFSLS
jgi:hypothetical protein